MATHAKHMQATGKLQNQIRNPYVVRGAMIGGFALVAYSAQYGSSGIMTFIVNHDGVVYEKDLGPKTNATAQVMTKFNSDKTWKKLD